MTSSDNPTLGEGGHSQGESAQQQRVDPREDPFTVRETAALLYAADMMFFREHQNADFQLDWCRSLLRRGEDDLLHCGDCNNQPQTCMRCLWEEWRDKALLALNCESRDWMGKGAQRDAVEAEREACALICDAIAEGYADKFPEQACRTCYHSAEACAQTIRERGKGLPA